MAELSLRPIHYASVSGGKDSLYMLKVIANNPQKYPLDMIVNFDLEIEWPFTERSKMAIQAIADKLQVPFQRIKPKHTWAEQRSKWGFPTRQGRWCNSSYKLECKQQLEKWIKDQKCRPVAYIGFCADESRRFKYRVGGWNPEADQDVCYPLAEEGVEESSILSWAQTEAVGIFHEWYWLFKRQGCMMCPMLSMKELAYLKLKEPGAYSQYKKGVEEMETKTGKPYFHKFFHEIESVVDEKYVQLIKAEMLNYSRYINLMNGG